MRLKSLHFISGTIICILAGIQTTCNSYFFNKISFYSKSPSNCSSLLCINNDEFIVSTQDNKESGLYYFSLKPGQIIRKILVDKYPVFYRPLGYNRDTKEIIYSKVSPHITGITNERTETLWKLNLLEDRSKSEVYIEGDKFRDASISHNCRWLLFGYTTTIRSSPVDNVLLMDVHNKTVEILTTMRAYDVSSWSFNDQQIAVSMVPLDSYKSYLYIYNLSDRTFKKVSDTIYDQSNIYLAWTPDNKKIILSHSVKDRGFQLIELNIENQEIIKLTSSKDDATSPTITPDGRKIAFIWHKYNTIERIIAFLKR